MESYWKLWCRVRAYGTLPEAGGLLDQNEATMRVLDIIQREYDKRAARAGLPPLRAGQTAVPVPVFGGGRRG